MARGVRKTSPAPVAVRSMPEHGDDRLSRAEAGLLLTAFSTLLCTVMLGVID